MEEKEEIEVLEETSRKKHGSTVIIVLLVLLLVGLSAVCGWFANSYFNDSKCKLDEEEKKIDNYTVTEEEAFRLFTLFLSDRTTGGTGNYGVGLMESFASVSEVTMKDLDNDTKIRIIERALTKEDIVNNNSDGGEYNLGYYEILTDSIKKYALLYFNGNVELPDSFFRFPSNCKLDNNKYKCSVIPTGGETTAGWIYIPTSYNIKDNTLQVDGFVVYDEVVAYYAEKGSNNGYCENVNYDSVKTCLKQNSQSFKKVSITFDISNDKYLFVSIKK